MKKALLTALACVFLGATVAPPASPGSADNRGVVLPTEWRLSQPTGPVVATGTLPQGAARTADGAFLVEIEDGEAAPMARIFDARTLEPRRTIPLEGASGSPLVDATGSGFWVSLAAGDAIAHVDAATGEIDRRVVFPSPFWAAAIARSPDGKTLAVDGDLAGSVRFIDLASGRLSAAIAVGAHPFGLAYARDGATLYVANWGDSTVSAIDVATQSVRATIAVGQHPEALALSRDGTHLYVSEADDDAVGIVDTVATARVGDIALTPLGSGLAGTSPTALALTADGTRLYVAESALDAVAVVDLGDHPRVVGAIPTGWYPTALVLSADDTSLDVVDGMGESSHPNPQYRPFARPRNEDGYVAHETIGSIRRVPIPSDAGLAMGLATVLANAGVVSTSGTARSGLAGRKPDDLALPTPPRSAVVRPNGPIHHVIYVIKENRTYDQVLGDLPHASGDPSLVLFGEDVTPNEHALARRFGILDDTMADAEVSADGHNWSVGAFANDYLERMWPPVYGGRRKLYDFEDGASASTPHDGYLWNAAKRAGVSVRNYGEFTTEIAMTPHPHIVSHMKDLAEVTDPLFPGFDLTFSDLDREREWKREFDAYVRNRNLPQLEIVRLPNDHTAATKPGALTPSAYVAQNDRAVGELVDAVSHSPYWRDTAIFIVEDDAQNGADHVDAHRMPAYVASAYSAGGVVHREHSTAGVLRTIETILGLAPLSVYDATASTLDDAFAPGAIPDLRPFDALPARIDLTTTNATTAYRARTSARMDFSREDAVPDATFDEIVARAARDANAARAATTANENARIVRPGHLTPFGGN